MPDRVWYYASGGQQQGPVKTVELQRLAAAGQLLPSDLVWTDSMANWAPASAVNGLFPTEHAPLAAALPSQTTTEAAPPGAAAVIGPEANSEASEQLQAAREFARRASREAAGAMRQLVSDPWGRLGTVYEQLGPKRAMMVGGAFLATFFLCCLLAVTLKRTVLLPGVASLESMTAAAILKTLIVLIAYVGTLLATVALFRMAARTGTALAGDLFIVGTALLPLGGFVLVAGLLDPLSPVVQWLVRVLFVFAAITGILILYNGLGKVVRLSDRMSAMAVPAVLSAAMTVAQILTWLLTRSV